jgi:hypothetical protein
MNKIRGPRSHATVPLSYGRREHQKNLSVTYPLQFKKVFGDILSQLYFCCSSHIDPPYYTVYCPNSPTPTSEPVVWDNCWDLIPHWNEEGIDSYEELALGTDSFFTFSCFGR